MCVNNLPRVLRVAERAGLEPATYWLQVQCLNHYVTMLTVQREKAKNGRWYVASQSIHWRIHLSKLSKSLKCQKRLLVTVKIQEKSFSGSGSNPDPAYSAPRPIAGWEGPRCLYKDTTIAVSLELQTLGLAVQSRPHNHGSIIINYQYLLNLEYHLPFSVTFVFLL